VPPETAVGHIHLDPAGGLAGDMFLAAVLHAWPDLEETVVAAMRRAGLPDDWRVEVEDGVSAGITGKRVRITGDAGHHHHATGSFKDIRARLEAAGLDAGVRDRAIDIFHRLAVAEAEVHGKTVDEVHFHEIADWDSVADITGAAAVIEAVGVDSWSVGDLPLGGGTVMTAHGKIPVPAPATALLLRGYRLVDDGVTGERITPTGAAILTHLEAEQGGRSPGGTLSRTGHGLGTKEFPGLANILRLVAFEGDTRPSWGAAGQVGVISFEVDDQTPESLAAGLDRLRASEGVMDAVQFPVTAKKGRAAVSVQVLCAADQVDPVIEACFLQTTTIGLRWRIENRVTLNRSEEEIAGLSVKRVTRPDGTVTSKADMDGVSAAAETEHARAELKAKAERADGEHDG